VVGAIAPFGPAQADRRRRLSSGGPLVGRNAELTQLERAFAQVQAGGREIVLIGGYPCAGKTTLVEALRHTAAPANTVFVRSDADQYRASSPYAALVQALRERRRLILAVEPAQAAAWKEIGRSLGRDGACIAELVPELQLLLAGEIGDCSAQSSRAKRSGASVERWQSSSGQLYRGRSPQI